MTDIIGFAGRKGHGKDTAAQEFVNRGYTLLRFADPLKYMLRAFYNCCGLEQEFIERKIEGDLKEVPCALLCGRTPRYAMQTLGTEWGRSLIGESLWVDVLDYRARALDDIVVPDVRFPNEVETIANLGGRVWLIDASRRVPPDDHSTHASEATGALWCDRVVCNDGTLDDLRAALA